MHHWWGHVESVHDYHNFASAVRATRRFIQTEEVASFLRCVSTGGREREILLPAGKLRLWRAQRGCREVPRSDDEGHEWVEYAPYEPERMKPLRRNPSEGRVNPRGVAYLYLTTDQDTAIAEVRPWRGALVSVGAFATKRDLRLVDCTRNHGKPGGWLYLLGFPTDQWDKLTAAQIDEAVWADIDNAFSVPVDPEDEFANYVPTQIVAEQFLADGFDGIVHKSALSDKGFNLTLFNPADAEMSYGGLFEVKGVKYEAKLTAEWFVENGRYVTNVVTVVGPAPKA